MERERNLKIGDLVKIKQDEGRYFGYGVVLELNAGYQARIYWFDHFDDQNATEWEYTAGLALLEEDTIQYSGTVAVNKDESR